MSDVFFTHRVSSAPNDDTMEMWYDSVRAILKKNNIDGMLLEKKKKQKTGLTDTL